MREMRSTFRLRRQRRPRILLVYAATAACLHTRRRYRLLLPGLPGTTV